MEKHRYINTKFWDDCYIANLDPIEKLLFIYFLTNPLTNISGIYEIPLRRIAFDTGIDKEMILKVFERFSRDGKIYYFDGWVVIKNFIKNQKLNPSVKKGIKNELERVPSEIWLKIKEIDSLYTLCRSLYTGCEIEKEQEKEKEQEQEKENGGNKSLAYLSNIPQSDLDEFLKRFVITEKEIKNKSESLKLYCESNGRKYKNYKSFLLNALKKDFKEKDEKTSKYTNL